MAVFSLGKVVVAAAGTPVAITTNLSTSNSKLNAAGVLTCYSLIVQPLSSNVGKVYIGTSTMSRTTLAGVFLYVPIPTANSLPIEMFRNETAQAAFSATDIYVDADNANDGVLAHVIR